MNIQEINNGLSLTQEGVWVADSSSKISYPEEGNANCYQVEESSFWFQHRNQCILSALKHFHLDNETLWDIGGGNGFVAKGIQDAGYEVALIEPGIQGALNARKRGINNVVSATLQEIDFPPSSVAAFGLFDVLEHIEDRQSFLKLLYLGLADNGSLYLTVPAYKFLWSNEDDHAGHYTRYTIKSLGRELKEAGFKLQFATYIFFWLPLPILLLRAIPYRLGLRKEKSYDQSNREHKIKKGFLGKLLSSLLSLELNCFRKKKSLPFGGSILAVAIKE